MKRILLYAILFFVCRAQGQLIVNNTTFTPAQLVQNSLVGPGVSPTNIKFNGSVGNANSIKDQVAKFSTNFNPTNLGVSAGLLMTTGKAQLALGPNNAGNSTDITSSPFVGDADLAQSSGKTIMNVAILEFDFIATGIVLNFDYVFASEEYPEYSTSNFNDTFGFFLSGPGLAGPFSNNAVNIAKLPTTTTGNSYVTINNVNNGLTNSGPCVNCSYYVPNGTGSTPAVNTSIQYDGFTVPLRATAQLQCGQTYHIKLAIANATDNAFDSAVFLKNFTIPPLVLLDNFGLSDDPSVCYGETVTISSGLTAGSNIIKWYKDGVLIPGQSGPTLTVTSAGTYTLNEATPLGCQVAHDDIVIGYLPQIPITQPLDFNLCTLAAPPYLFNIDQTALMLGALDPSIYQVTYYDTNANNEPYNGAPNGIIPDTSLSSYSISTSSATIWVRIQNLLTDCVVVKSFNMNVLASPSGTIAYPASSYCNSISTSQAITTTTLTTGGTYSATPAGLSINASTGAIVPSSSTPGNYTVKYDIAASGSCNAYSTTTPVEIQACSCTVTASSTAETVCIGNALNAITYTVAGGALTAAVTSGTLPNGVLGNLSGGVYTISGTPTVLGTYNFTVSMDTGVSICSTATTINVTPSATITLSSAVSTTNQTVCLATGISPITYTIANAGATGATVTGLPNGVTGSYSAGTFTISGTPTQSGSFSYTVTTSGGCSTASLSGTLTVNPVASIVLSSALPTASQTVCINTGITAITYSVQTGGTGATVTGLPNGVTGAYSAGTFTISGTPTQSGTFSYTVTTSGGCATATITGTLTVTGNVTMSLTSGIGSTNQTVCINAALGTAITYAIANSDATGATVTGLPSGITGSFSAGVFTISGTPTQSGSFSYVVTTSGGCSSVTLAGLLNVAPATTIVLTSPLPTASQTVCINTGITSITYSVQTGGTGATVTGLPSGVTGSYSAGTFTISGTPTQSGNFSYTVTTSGGCATATITGTLTVTGNVTMSLTSGIGSTNQTVCINAALGTAITYAIANSDATGATVTGLPSGITGSFSAGVFTISGTPTQSGSFSYVVTTSGGCSLVTLAGLLNVAPATTIVLSSPLPTASQTVCINTGITSITYSVQTGGTGATVTGLPSGVTGAYSAGTFTISGTPTQSGAFSYTVTTSGGCSFDTITGTLTVNPIATIVLSSLPATLGQSVCIGTPITAIDYSVQTGGTGATVIGLPTGVTGTYSAGTFTISGTPTQSGTFPYTVTTTGGCGSSLLSDTLTVLPNVTMILTSAIGNTNQSLCINTNIAPITYAITNSDATGATVTGLPAGVTGSYSGGVFTISGTATQSGSFSYVVTTSGGCSQVNLGGLLNILPTATLVLSSASGDYTGCINQSMASPIVYSVQTGGTGATVTGLPNGVTGTYSGGNFTITGTPTQSGTFPYTVTTSGGCPSSSLSGTLTISPNVTMSLTSGNASQTLCINTGIASINYAIANSDATGATVTGLPTGVTGSYSAGVFTIAGTPSQSGTFAFAVTTSGGCSSVVLSGSLTVNPAATIVLSSPVPTASQTVCINTPIVSITYSVQTGGTGATVTGLPTGVIGTYAAGTFTISGTPTQSGSFPYTVTTSGGCSFDTINGTLSVTPAVTMNLTSGNANQTICINTNIASINYSIANSDAIGATVTGLPSGVTGTYLSGVFTISGASTQSGTFPYTIITSGGCSSVSLSGSLTVNPNATIVLSSPSASSTGCLNVAINTITYTIGSGATGASITSGSLPTGVTGVFAAGVFTISGTPTQPGIFNYVVATSGGCSSASLTGVITVQSNVLLLLTSPAGTSSQNPICLNAPIIPITYAIQNGGTGATVTGLPTGITGQYQAGVFTISGSTALTGVYNYTVTTTGGCSTASLGGTLTVVPDATIVLSSPMASPVCINTAISTITYTVGNGATGASLVSGTVPVGVTGTYYPTTKTFSISGIAAQAGTFTFTVTTTGGCSTASAPGTIIINPLPNITLPQDGYICVDATGVPITTYTLGTGLTTPAYSFVWSDATGVITGATTGSYTASAPGTYSVAVTNTATTCTNTAQATVAPSLAPSSVYAQSSSYFEDSHVTVYVTPPGAYLYQIDNGPFQQSNEFGDLSSGEHLITVKDKYGCGEKTTTIRIVNYPKYFTPNDDGYNDMWNISELAELPNQSDSRILIFDRYGKLLKEISPFGKGWDGTYNGALMPSTDYWFKVFYQEDGNAKEFKAHFAMKR